VADMLAGEKTYINIHDASFPGGRNSGRLFRYPEPLPQSGTIVLLGTASWACWAQPVGSGSATVLAPRSHNRL